MLEKVPHDPVSFLFAYCFVVHKKDYDFKATISSQKKKQKKTEIPSKTFYDWI